MVGAKDAGLSGRVGIVREPGRAGFLETSLEEVFMSGFDETRADGQFLFEG